MPFDDVTINFARAVFHYDEQQLDDGQHKAAAARRSLPIFLVYKGVVVDRCRVYFALLITSSAILPTCVLPVILSSSSSPPSSSLWSSLSSRITDRKFYAVANELTLAIIK